MKGQKSGGRQKGTLNKGTKNVRELAGAYTARAIAVLASIMENQKAGDQARAGAANMLLDRAVGKPPQAHTGEDGTGPIAVRVELHVHP